VSDVALDDDKLKAGLDMLRRTGAVQVQIRYSDDEKPIVWFVVAHYGDREEIERGEGQWEVDAAHEPVRALLRLLERLVDGGRCKHCGRATGLDPDSIETMPLNALICWYQYDPELKTFRRGCE
jgi:hypothetical protein